MHISSMALFLDYQSGKLIIDFYLHFKYVYKYVEHGICITVNKTQKIIIFVKKTI